MTPTLRPIAEQTVVIVGCSSGIGRLAAQRFAERGARLVLAGRGETVLADVLDDVRARGAADAIAIHADVTHPEELAEVARRASDAFGGIDTWLQVAAVELYARFEDSTPEEFRRVIEVNLLGMAYGAMAALPHLRARGNGALIEISSVEAEVPLPYQTAYAASKHGMAGFLRALRMEMEAERVPVAITQILPSGIDTPIFENARTKLGVAPKPVDPVYTPDVVVELILHAAEHPSKDLYAGGAGWLMTKLARWTPGLVEAGLVRVGMSSQRSDRPKDAGAPDNLEAPLRMTDEVRGGFGGRSFSLVNRVQMLPSAVRLGAIVAAVMGMAALVTRRR